LFLPFIFVKNSTPVKWTFFIVAIILVVIIKGGSNPTVVPIVAAGNDLIIAKSDISSVPKFVSYLAGSTKMEVIAVKTSEGKIRTAFNTCQVCYSSGRGYYKVVGETLVCQNCGNVFKFNQIGELKGGCNPVPIESADKTDNGANIVIASSFMQQQKQIFANWKK